MDRSGGDFEKTVELNATIQGERLRTASTVMQATKSGSLKVAAGVYILATGKVALS